jgi:DNA-binding transcriptional MerR regulator
MTTSLPSALTIGEIVRRTECPLHRVRYIIESRGIKPTSRAGVANVYREADLKFIASELRRIDGDRKGVGQ